MLKRVFLIGLLSIMVLFGGSVAFADVVQVDPVTPYFTDVLGTNYYFDAIQYVKEQGIVSGYPDGSYRPETPYKPC